ncbi:hypothetical protein AB1N83_005582 [Pleurotus pulmonarius]
MLSIEYLFTLALAIQPVTVLWSGNQEYWRWYQLRSKICDFSLQTYSGPKSPNRPMSSAYSTLTITAAQFDDTFGLAQVHAMVADRQGFYVGG